MSEEKKFYPHSQTEVEPAAEDADGFNWKGFKEEISKPDDDTVIIDIEAMSDTGRMDFDGYVDKIDNAEKQNQAIIAQAKKEGVSLEGVGEELGSLLDEAKEILEPLRPFGARLIMRYQEYKAEKKAVREAFEERLAAAEKLKAYEEEMKQKSLAAAAEMKRVREEIMEMAEKEVEGATKEVIDELERNFKPGADFKAKLEAAQTIPEKIAIIRQGLRESGLEPGEPADHDSITDDQELKNRVYVAANVVYRKMRARRTDSDQNADDGEDDTSSAARGSHLKLV